MPSGNVITIAVEKVEFFLRNVRTRIPFRFGNALLLGSPIMHVKLTARDASGKTAYGVSADALPPKWFDKDPAKDYRRNVQDQVAAINIAANQYLEIGSELKSPFALWWAAYPKIVAACAEKEINGLTAGLGSSLMERAVFDAAGKLAHTTYHAMVRENRLGFKPETVHPELSGRRIEDAIAPSPLQTLYVRHTVGLADQIWEDEITAEDRVTDGFPQSLEAVIRVASPRYYKIKIFGNLDKDLARLQRIAAVLERGAPTDYKVTIDGNEQFKTAGDVTAWLDTVSNFNPLKKFTNRVIFLEQPMDRAIALTQEGARSFAGVEGLPPVIIDESDDSLDTFKKAAELGYRGVSSKNCKGVFKGLLNKMLVDLYNEQSSGRYLMSGEDLTNISIVPLQQDLCTLSVLGIDHAERNGHHYYRGLDHLSATERAACLVTHRPLYERHDNTTRLRIVDGQLDLRSLHPIGYGVGVDIDFASMTPLVDWSFDSMGLS